MTATLLAQVAYRFDWPGFWIILGVALAELLSVLYVFMRSQTPPGGPRGGS